MTTAFKEYLATEIGTTMVISDRVMVQIDKMPELRAHQINIIVNALTTDFGLVSWPSDWWQAFKDRWFPCWLKTIYPVRYSERKCSRICPHLGEHDKLRHYSWLDSGELR